MEATRSLCVMHAVGYVCVSQRLARCYPTRTHDPINLLLPGAVCNHMWTGSRSRQFDSIGPERIVKRLLVLHRMQL